MAGCSVQETTGNSGERGKAMQALVDSHLFVRNMKPNELFRAAYMSKFGKDITAKSLEDDVATYLQSGKIPPYLIDFMVKTYGAM